MLCVGKMDTQSGFLLLNFSCLSLQDEVFRELKALEKDIQRSKSDLEQVNPEYEKLLAQEEEIIKG